MVAVNKESFAIRVKSTDLRWSQNKVLSKLKVLGTEIGESLKAMLERTTEGSTPLYKKFEAEVAQGLERIYTVFKDKAAKIFDGLTTSLSESTSGAQRKIANCVAMLSNRLAGVREGNSDKPSVSASGTSSAAAVTAPSTSVG